jgi:RNA recognition motif-containing protein
MLQAGRIVNVHLPKDRVTQTHQGYGFVEFQTEEDAEYAAKIMNQVRLYGKPIRVNKASADKQKSVEVGAELFVGNLDPMVDEKTLYDTFSRFGTLVQAPKVCGLLTMFRVLLTLRRLPGTSRTSQKATASCHLPTSSPRTKPSPT